ncbi:hypothetical protein H0H93_011937 [Arthromyces matolae]|nr:hypothetical protein H0H93_011937 [Arthromyces matolae]
MMTEMVLGQFAQGMKFIAQPLHATLFPYPIAATVHAARISLAYQVNARAASASSGTKLSWPAYIAGYLVMTWGGTFITHTLLHLPPPMLYSFTPYIIYITVHLTITFLTFLFPFFLFPSFLALLDTVLFPLDALVRTGAVTGTTAQLASPFSAIAEPLKGSITTYLIIGAFASAGGGLTASTLSTWSASWSFSTPPVLRASTLVAFIWASMDVWAGAMVAAVHAVLTGKQPFIGVQSSVVGIFGGGNVGQPWLSDLEAKAAAAAVLAMCFAARAYRTHWAGETSKKMDEKKVKSVKASQ